MSSRLSDYQYDLPPELIADRPTPSREESRMMVVDRPTGKIEHSRFSDLPEFLRPSDLLVLNDSRVIPARLHDATGKIEILLLERRDPLHWTAMVRPGKKMRAAATIEVAGTTATVLEILEDGTRLLAFSSPPDLERHGEMPIPPTSTAPPTRRTANATRRSTRTIPARSLRPRRDSTSHRRSLRPSLMPS